MATMKKAQKGAKITNPADDYKGMKNAKGKPANIGGGEGKIPPFPNGRKGMPYAPTKMGGAKNGTSMKKAQNGVNTLLPGGYAPKASKDKYGGMPAKSKTKAKSTIEEATPKEIKKYGLSGSRSAKSGTSINKYQMGGFVSNEFAAKSSVKAKPKSKFIDSPIKTTRGKDINAFQGKKGMLAKSGGSFPDLNKDGKVTKADILKGRGVIAKSGAKMKKAKAGTSMKKCKYGCN